MGDESTTGVPASSSPAGDASTALATSGSDSAVGAAASPVSTTGATVGATTIEAPASADLTNLGGETTNLQSVLDAIAAYPADDSDFTQANFPHREALVSQRQQLRQLSAAARELPLLENYRSLGSVETLQPKAEYYDLLFSPVLDAGGNRVIDAETNTPRYTTAPFVERLDLDSPGSVEQLFADLGPYRPLLEDGVSRGPTLMQSYFHFLGLDPAKLADYRNIDALVAQTGAVTPEELAEIPEEYRPAYRTLPHAIRYNWRAYDEASRLQLLNQAKRNIDSDARDARLAKQEEARKAADTARFHATVAAKQEEYFSAVRQERYNALMSSLANVQFSADPATDAVIRWSAGAAAINLLDRDWRFAATQGLAALGVTLDQSFDEAVAKFEVNAADKVALELSGDTGRAKTAAAHAKDAADEVMAKVATVIAKVVQKMGGQQQAQATGTAAAISAAASARPVVGINGGAPATLSGILPQGMNPASPEAAQWLAEQTGFIRA